MKVYHATNFDNLSSIIANGLEPKGEGIFVAESFEQALAFVALRNYSTVAVFELDLPENELTESFDHSESMFCKLFGFDSCRAFVYSKHIPADDIDLDACRLYDTKRGK